MDLVDFSEERFREIEPSCETLSERLGLHDVRVIPMSALRGDNVVERGDGDALVRRADAARAPRDGRDRRRPQPRRPPLPRAVGDPADVRRAPRLPRLRGPGRRRRLAGRRRRRRAAVRPPLARRLGRDRRRRRSTWPIPGQSITIRLEDDVDVSRGDMLADPERPPIVARELDATALLDEREAARAAREARDQAHDAHRARDRRRARLGRRHPHARGPARARSGSS